MGLNGLTSIPSQAGSRVAASSRKMRVLIVDDSAVMRSLLRGVVESDSRLEVVGTASDGAAALRATDALQPDLVLLDVEMPVMDGLTTLRQMKGLRPNPLTGRRVPVIMCSTFTQRGAQVTIEALANGAADYVAKPYGQASREASTQRLASELIPKILALTQMQPVPAAAVSAGPAGSTGLTGSAGPVVSASASARPSAVPAPLARSAPVSPPLALPAAPPAVVVIGVSTGGPAVLDILLPALPASFQLPVLVVQHMPELFTRLLAERLDGRCHLHVKEAVHGEPVCPGTIYIARGDWHMEIAGNAGAATLRLTQEPLENHCRPAADVLFRTAVAVYGSRVLGVVLTGIGSDGLEGCRMIRQHNGSVLVQDRATSTVWGMPAAVSEAGLAHRVLPIEGISSEILRLSARSPREAAKSRELTV
jgi:two-component system, chemotaxis family, protein-glutamate methylesterase/glutaminase